MFTASYHDFFDLDNSVAWSPKGAAIVGLMVKWWFVGEKRSNSEISKLQGLLFHVKD